MTDAIALPPASLAGTLLLPLETVQKTGNLFPVMALMLRAAGMQVLVIAQRDITRPLVDKRAALLHIPFTQSAESPLSGRGFHEWKFAQAQALLRKGPVLWPDLDFSQWAGPNCVGVTGLTILNVGAMLQQGVGGVRPGAAS